MTPYVLYFNQLDHSSLPYVGGKGANLGEMTKAGFPVPGGFCVTTRAYKDFIMASSEINEFFEVLAVVDPADLNQLRELGEKIRTHLEQLMMPVPIREEICKAWAKQSPDTAYAIRSSATAEDLPIASFAGQQDTYLNIKGQDELLKHVRKCWASLFTDRAIAYRTKNGFDHRDVYLSIVVQEMIIPDVSGIMFTADPVNGNRTVVSIDASFGLGEALVSGMVTADLYKVKNDSIIHKKVSQKKIAIYSLPEGGTITKELPIAQQEKQALTDEQIIELAQLGKKIEQHYNSPQDIEFCVVNNEFYIVQSRPITTLYPLPDIPQKPLRVLLSWGHIQMMSDAMTPLGLSVLRMLLPDKLPVEAGGRLFADLTDFLQLKLVRRFLPQGLNMFDKAMGCAMAAVINRPDFLADALTMDAAPYDIHKIATPLLKKMWEIAANGDLEQVIPSADRYMKIRIEESRQALGKVQGSDRIKEVQRQLDTMLQGMPENIMVYMITGQITRILLKKVIDLLQLDGSELYKLNISLPGNVTSEMGLELGDLADLLRKLPAVQEYLKTANDQTFYAGFSQVTGGDIFRQAFDNFIEGYGMRCPGEVDITNPRWREKPTQVLSALFSHMHSVKPGEHRERFTEGEKDADAAAEHILQQMQGNSFEVMLVSRLITIFRHLGGLREHHKYLMISIMDECKKAIMLETDKLVQKGLLAQAEDIYYLRLEEIIQLLQGDCRENTAAVIAERKEQFLRYQSLKPPRVMTSEGEVITVPLNREDISERTLIGSGVSAGVVEGIARIILRAENASLNAGEILVAPQTDPGWTLLFQSAVAIVTEVGGLMTHGSVVAREYGIPAVVGVDDATTLIQDGERIRVDGDQGLVERLEQDTKK